MNPPDFVPPSSSPLSSFKRPVVRFGIDTNLVDLSNLEDKGKDNAITENATVTKKSTLLNTTSDIGEVIHSRAF
jgi:hypothetical protein